ncbi:MAG: hypothetical protein WCV50_03970 [Patescibacteria group bacterium]|jgi:hypothetical protein
MNEPEKKQIIKKSHALPVILVVVWVAIIGLFAYSVWSGKQDKNENNYDEIALTSPENTNSEEISAPAVNVNMTEDEKTQARIRDSKRLSDMKRLRSILDEYRSKNGYYPEELENIVPDYIDALPQNPGPGGQPYVYNGIGSKPYTYYALSYELEVGDEGIDPGLHIAAPGSIAEP